MKKVLIIDDDPENRALVSEMLGGSYQSVLARDGQEGLKLAVSESPSLILLDVNMPGMNGFEVCRRLAEIPATLSIPVIMLTTETGLESRVQGLNVGADDYVTKPFRAEELLARIGARLRRKGVEERSEAVLTLGNLTADPKSGEVRVAGAKVTLTTVEFDVLRYFLERPERLIDRTQVLGDLWPDAVVTERTVDTHIGNLRRKLRGFDHAITTVYGSGYILKKPD